MGLFGNKEEKQQEEAAAREAAERFAAMSPKELGAVLLPSLGPNEKLQAHNWMLMGM